MDNTSKYLFVRFKLDKKINKMTGFILSEERSTVEAWDGDGKNESEEEETAPTTQEMTFQRIAQDFPTSIEVFRRTVPFIMRGLPFLRQLNDDDRIRGFVKRNGALLDSGELETYQIGIDHTGELTRRLDNSTAIAAGIKNLPGMFLVGLISAYDVFLAQVIRAMFFAQPGILSSSERNISFKDLTEIGSIEAARERIIEKEIEGVLRESHAEQIKWLESKLNMTLTKDLKVWPDFIELCERRNLLTHTAGIISSQYVSVCNAHGKKKDPSLVGQQISIDPEYYTRAVEIVLEMGSKLVQVMWRKLVPEDIEQADQTLNDFAYKLIVKRMYRLAATMLRFGLYEMKKHGTEATRRQMVVNYANAEKLSGNRERATKILDNEDWTATTDLFKICVAAVKDDLDTVLQLMRPVVEGKPITLQEFREWPVFGTVRTESRFIEAFEREFGQKLVVDKQVTNLQGQRDSHHAPSPTDSGDLYEGGEHAPTSTLH